MRNPEIDNGQDIIDSRDIIARIEELESLIEENNELADEDKEDLTDETEELEKLKALADEGANCAGDWEYGAALIRESYWVDYVQDLLADIGDLPRDLPHYIVIDWEQTAENIRADYSTVTFDGVAYYVRS